jgi:hypothetical protein
MIQNLKGSVSFNITLTKYEIELIEHLVGLSIECDEDVSYAIGVILEQVK